MTHWKATYNENLVVPAEGAHDAKIAFVGMAPAADEVREGRPMVGPAGRRLNAALAANNIKRSDVFITNVLDFPIQVGSSIFSIPHSTLARSVDRLKQELISVNPNVCVPLGSEPFKVICGLDGIMQWRGSILPSRLIPNLKCVPTVHPAWIVRGAFKWEAVFRHIDIARALEESTSPIIDLPVRECVTGPSFSTVMEYLVEAHSHPYIAFDYETMYWSGQHMGEIACVAISWRPDLAICIPFLWEDGRHYWSEEEEAYIWQALGELLQNQNVGKIAQNAPFEWLYSWTHKIFPWPLFIDTMTLHHCLYPDFGAASSSLTKNVSRNRFDEPGHGLAFINSHYTRTPYFKGDGHNWHPALGIHQFWRYNCYDSMVTLEVALKMMEEAKEANLWDFYIKRYIRPFPHALRMEWAGVAVNVPKRIEAGIELTNRINELQKEINIGVGFNLNVNSPKQVYNLLYEKRRYKTQYRTLKRGGRVIRVATADKFALQKLAVEHQDPVLQKIEELRSTRTLRADLVEAQLGPDQRVHTHYNIGGTDSGRWSSTRSITGTGTNLQNIPAKGIARKLFIPVPSFEAK